MRWADAVPRTAAGRAAAGKRGTGNQHPSTLSCGAAARGRSRRGHRTVGRRDALPQGRRPVVGEIQAHSVDRSVVLQRRRPAGRAQSGDLGGGRGPWAVLRAGSVVADRMHDRRQRRRELRRRALPEVRPHRAQCPKSARGADRRRRGRVRRRGARCRRLRPARADHRFRRTAGGHHRGHRQADADAAAGDLRAGELRRSGKGGRRGRGDHRRRASYRPGSK